MLVAEKQTNENIVTVNTLAILLDFPSMDSCFLTKRLIFFGICFLHLGYGEHTSMLLYALLCILKMAARVLVLKHLNSFREHTSVHTPEMAGAEVKRPRGNR